MPLFPQVGRKQPGLRIAWWLIVLFLCVGVLLHLFPFYYMLAVSFTPASEFITSATPVLWPKQPTVAAWKLVVTIVDVNTRSGFDSSLRVFLEYPFHVYFRNSLFMTLATLALSLPVTSMAAYANSKLQRGRAARWSFLIFIGTLMVPGVVTLIPAFLLTRNFPFPLPTVPNIPGTSRPFPYLRIWNTPWAVIIPGVFNAFNFLLFKGFFDTIPDSVIQAARVDGGSEFNIFRRIVLPMSVPVYAVAAWLQFGGVWDSYLWPLVVMQDPARVPVSVAVAKLMTAFLRQGASNAEQAANMANNPLVRQILESGLSWNGLMVLGLLQSIPIFLMFIVCREYLMKGIRIRGLR
ncbi:MAG: carbohydrate ABC transporter permease [Anaerolineae bacterium]|nr:carbohydrate ABC transporter permease [Anaerolineae bacterium]